MAARPKLKKTAENPLGVEPYEGEAVTELGLEIPAAGGGFQPSLDVDVTLLDMLAGCTKGDVVYAVLELTKKQVKHREAKNHDGWRRIDIFKVNGVAIIDADMAVEAVQAQRERVVKALEAADGIQRVIPD